jgi:hypothetical protein
MKINQKQQKLIDKILERVKENYPEIVFKNLQRSPEDPRDIWINVIADMDEDREIELRHFSAKVGNEIFNKYGFDIFIMPENPNTMYA